MFVATAEFELLFGHVPSLKVKRSLVRPLVAEIRRTFPVACAEVGDADLLRRASIGVAVVSNDAGHARSVLEGIEDLLLARPESELLAVARRVFRPSDDFPAVGGEE